MNKDSKLKMENITKSFSGVKVVDSVNLYLGKGEVLGLVGENGAGKSTLMNILGGIHKCDEGEIVYNGEEFKPINALDASRNGIAFIHQELSLFNNLSVVENMFIDAFPRKKIFKIIDKRLMVKKAKEALKWLNADININTIVEDLEIGKRQQVEIAKALIKKASVIIFDEPTSSLSSYDKNNLFKVINNLKNSGVSIIYISHNLEEVFYLCDRIMVMRDGKSFPSIEKEKCKKDDIVKLMVGRELKDYYVYTDRDIGGVLMKVKDIKLIDSDKEVSFEVREGEIVGLYGLMGAGRSEVLRAIYGVDKMESGKVWIRGNEIKKLTPEILLKNGAAFLTENRSEEGLFLNKSVKDNLVIAYLKYLVKFFSIIDSKKENKKSQEIVEKVKVKTFNKNIQTARYLSGGNQQKVVVGKWLLTEPKIFLMDEPTRGIDVGAKYEIYGLINALTKNGSGALFVSSEMEELMGICDRILVMRQGEISGEIPRNEYTQEGLVSLALAEEKR